MELIPSLALKLQKNFGFILTVVFTVQFLQEPQSIVMLGVASGLAFQGYQVWLQFRESKLLEKTLAEGFKDDVRKILAELSKQQNQISNLQAGLNLSHPGF